jgi:hypothetical protein
MNRNLHCPSLDATGVLLFASFCSESIVHLKEDACAGQFFSINLFFAIKKIFSFCLIFSDLF